MGNLGTVNNACGGNFYDSGGPAGNYGNNQNFTATFCAPPGQYITFNFTSFNTEFLFDWLDIYDGPNTGAPLIGSYTGAGGPGMITSALGGCVTFVFTSDNSVPASGWVATITCSSTPPSTGNDCISANPFCTNNVLTFPNNTNQPDLGQISCLLTTPNPVWYYMQIQNPGNLNIDISQVDGFGFGIDVDFALWGPFTSLAAGCVAIAGGAPTIDCSYSPSPTEQANIVGALTGQFYIMLLTNYSNDPGTITFGSGAGSTATTNCGLLCSITDVTANPTACNASTNTYTVNGQVTFANAPTSGTLTIVTSCGGSATYNAPFASPLVYSIPGVPANGALCNVTATFSNDPSCSFTQSYTAPASCGSAGLNCPNYANVASGPNTGCAGQVYYFDVANTACNGTITFNVIGFYGSPYGDEITWNVVSNLTGTVVASGGPGTFGVNTPINVTVGPLNPAVVGNIFTLNVFDAWGDGFDANGTISIVQGGNTIAGPIAGPGAWTTSSITFGANIAISHATINITTPTGVVTQTVTGCNDFHVPLSFQNANFCNTINISLPFTVTCVSNGSLISSGTKNITVYPSIPSSATDLVDISFNPATCTWSMSPQNDCIAANIGTIFTVSPNPATVTPPNCTAGGENFTVTYNGIASGPNCCSTGGPLIPIVYNQTFPQSTVTTVNSPFGGTNNSALLTIPPNLIGGNATSLTFNYTINGFCNTGALNNYWVTVIIDGNIITDTWYNPAPVNNSISLNLAAIPNGYNQNSVIQVYVYPNQLAPATYNINGVCGSLGANQWTADLTGNINATFSDLQPTPGVCVFNPFIPFSCCSSTPVADGSASICSGGSLTALTLWQASVAAANPNCIVYSSVTPVAGSVLPDNLLPNGVNAGTTPINQVVSAYSYCDADGSATINTGDTYTLVSTFTLTVQPVPTASISGATTICAGGSAVISFNGTPNATVTYTINGGANQFITLNGLGTATLNTGALAAITTYALVAVSTPGPPVCSQVISGTVLITVGPPPDAGSNGSITLCSNGSTVNLFSSLGGTPQATGTWSGPGALTGGNLGTFDPASNAAGVYTYTVSGTAPCVDATATVTVTLNTAPNAGTNGSITLCSNGSTINLFSSLGGTPQATGTWSGPGVLTGGNLGTFDPASNSAGVYTYTVTGTAPCVDASATITVTLSASPSASIQYPGSPYCTDLVTAQSVTLSGTPGGSFSSVPAGLSLNPLTGAITPSTSTPGTYTVTYSIPASGGCAAFSVSETVVIQLLPPAPGLIPSQICEGDPTLMTASGGTLYEFFINSVSQGPSSNVNTFTTPALNTGDVVCVRSYPGIPFNFDGNLTEQEWGSPWSTSANGPPASGFGAGNNLDAIKIRNGSGYLFGGVASNVVNNSNNRILVFIDCRPGGFNNLAAWVNRSAAPYWSVENLSAGIVFDAGFTPDYILAMNQAGGDAFFDLYDMVNNVNNFLGTASGSPWLGFIGNAGTSDYSKGFEFAIPMNALSNPSGSIGYFSMLVNDPGFGVPTTISNQFLSPCGSSELNYGNGAVNFGAALPNPVSVALSADCSSETCVTVVSSITPVFNPVGPLCSGDPAPLLPTTSLNGISGTWSPAVVNNTASGSYTFTPNTGQCADPVTISVTVEPTPALTPIYHD